MHGAPVVPFYPFSFWVPLLKPNSRKKGTLTIKGLLGNLVIHVQARVWSRVQQNPWLPLNLPRVRADYLRHKSNSRVHVPLQCMCLFSRGFYKVPQRQGMQ